MVIEVVKEEPGDYMAGGVIMREMSLPCTVIAS